MITFKPKIMDMDYSTIDERIREVVKLLNEAGLETSGSCQGADFDSMDEYREYYEKNKGHHSEAYIQFFDYQDLPQRFVDLIELNTRITFDYFFEDETDTRCQIGSVSMLLNKSFPEEVERVLFKFIKELEQE